jgi:ribonuclease E
MPNMSKGGGVSRKVSDPKDRSRLKKIVSELKVENGSLVIRTAGVGHSKPEIKKDFDYLTKLWDEVRETTFKSTAPSLIYEETSIIKRAIRDLYSRDIESIIIEGEEAYKTAKDFTKKLIPTHVKKVKLYDDPKVPLFSKFKINNQINQIYSPRVDLPSGGYLVINTTEALVAIDVNSGRSTRERNISGTALKTNLEAAAEIARQCRLRDLGGLIVVDFIDMEDKRNRIHVERSLREALRDDKAKIQVGGISNFGLLELSRQRQRSSITDANMVPCSHCNGFGSVWSDESIALQVLRKIEETCFAVELAEVRVSLSTNVAMYLLNHKRDFIGSIEKRGLKIGFDHDATIMPSDFKITPVAKPLVRDRKDKEDVVQLERPSAEESPKELMGRRRPGRPPRDRWGARKNQRTPEAEASSETVVLEASPDRWGSRRNQRPPEAEASPETAVPEARPPRNRWGSRRNQRTSETEASSETAVPEARPPRNRWGSRRNQRISETEASSETVVLEASPRRNRWDSRKNQRTSETEASPETVVLEASPRRNRWGSRRNRRTPEAESPPGTVIPEANQQLEVQAKAEGPEDSTPKPIKRRGRRRISIEEPSPLPQPSIEKSAVVKEIVGKVDIPERQEGLRKLANSYRDAERKLEELTTFDVYTPVPKEKKKNGWWQKLIKKDEIE